MVLTSYACNKPTFVINLSIYYKPTLLQSCERITYTCTFIKALDYARAFHR